MSLSTADDARLERQRREAFAEALARNAASIQQGSPCIAVRTCHVAGYPAMAGRFVAVKRIVLSGSEVEGDPVTKTELAYVFYVAHVGHDMPPEPTDTLAFLVDGLYCIDYST